MVTAALVGFVAWVGYCYALMSALNFVYGCALPKPLLKPLRHLTGLLILAFPPLYWLSQVEAALDLGMAAAALVFACVPVGGLYAVVTLVRHFRRPPACVASETTRTIDLWPELGEKLIGDGKGQALTRVPGNGAFKIDVTDLTLRLPNRPPELSGLTILLLTDLHFHGTPSRLYFERVLAELAAGPVPDLVCLGGDYLDSDAHHHWIRELLGPLRANVAKLAVLGNHDLYHDPDRARAELAAAGCVVLGNGWREIAVRGVPVVVVGHEGPWFGPQPDLSGAPAEPFRLCLSHTPDNFYWGVGHRVGLMLCGHVHGGAVRVPLLGSIFVPSKYGRRFDMGVFEKAGTVMVVSRGVSGKEPLRVRCNPQAIRITLA
jgi:hypothetical protein